MTLEERIGVAARAIKDFCDGYLEHIGAIADPRSFQHFYAEAALRAAFPELFSDPPSHWLAPWEATEEMIAAAHVANPLGCDVELAAEVYPPTFAAMRDSHLSKEEG